ncbi:unnamed protein product [Ilex paraguariensis]|uniref:Uncharacterized protein n=1 Tax=Ilex paraguariensis TaxID=185542 RepID=A0ABC8REV1_9AQUA
MTFSAIAVEFWSDFWCNCRGVFDGVLVEFQWGFRRRHNQSSVILDEDDERLWNEKNGLGRVKPRSTDVKAQLRLITDVAPVTQICCDTALAKRRRSSGDAVRRKLVEKLQPVK